MMNIEDIEGQHLSDESCGWGNDLGQLVELNVTKPDSDNGKA